MEVKLTARYAKHPTISKTPNTWEEAGLHHQDAQGSSHSAQNNRDTGPAAPT
jgi:hypothetical protein